MSKYEFSVDMKEISGFGGNYERTCRTMLKAGMEWLDKHPSAHPKYGTYKNVTGICSPSNSAARRLDRVLSASIDDCTLAIHQVVVETCLWIRKNGWDKYVEIMKL